MGKPAARLGDMTAHGGSIVVGLPTVLIGGMPAARVGDMHVCPMLNPGVPPPPHVGGPIMMGSPMVLIGGMPAARMGDMVTCAGPPDTIMLGCMTVLIGEGGSGSAAGGGAGTTAAAAAQSSAATAKWNSLEATTKREHWIEFQCVDKAGLAISGVQYALNDPRKKDSQGTLGPDGRVRRDDLPQGQGSMKLVAVSNAHWSKKKAKVGEKVKMSADVEGYDAGTLARFQIYQRDIRGADHAVQTIDAKTQGAKVEAEWEYIYPEDRGGGARPPQSYSAPEYYFDVVVGRSMGRSDLLSYQDWIEIELRDAKGKPIPNQEYVVYLSNGEVRQGKLDGNGFKKVEGIVPGGCSVRFPGMAGSGSQKK